jgi:succinylglutamic semialdehyde dehydrogenase
MMKTHYIHYRWTEGSGEEFVSTDPATEEVNWRGRAATGNEVDAAYRAALAAFEKWSDLSADERIEYSRSFKEVVLKQRDELAEIISRESGKPLWESYTEVDAIIGKVGLSIEAHTERRHDAKQDLGGAASVLRYRPHGVIAVFGPFNLPGHLPHGHIIPALIAGNTIVFKPSEQTPLVAQKLMEYWIEADLPPGVLNVVQGGRETGMAVAQNPKLDGLFFTGSVAAGKALHISLAGKPEKIVALEMGGNNPLIVAEIHDPESAAYIAVQSAYITSGQRCTCARRLIVPKGNEGDLFLEALMSLMGRIKVGQYTDTPEPFMGPVISRKAQDDLLTAQERLRKQGGRVLMEMIRLDRPGHFLSPGLMDVTQVPDRLDEEIFGPFLQVIRVQDFEAAIKEANNTAFGLSAGLISRNPKLYERFRKKIRAGVVNWNRQTTGASGKLPFGGLGRSGNHRPSGFFAADYCSDPIAYLEVERPATMPDSGIGIIPLR